MQNSGSSELLRFQKYCEHSKKILKQGKAEMTRTQNQPFVTASLSFQIIFAKKNIELMSHLQKFLNTCLFSSSLVQGVICYNRALYFYYMLTPFSIFLYASSFSPLNIGCIRSSGSRKSKNECTPFGIIFEGCDDSSLFSHLDHSSKWSSNYWHSGT